MNEQQHNATKKKLRVIGIILIIVGVLCMTTGIVDFSLAFNGKEVRDPTLFFLIFLGSPIMVAGIICLIFGFKKEIGMYIKNESVPVINEAAGDLKPAIKSVVSAVKEGLNGEEKQSDRVCSHCGKSNDGNHAFCSFCGKPLGKTCPVCGAQQEYGDAFCGKCGAKLEN